MTDQQNKTVAVRAYEARLKGDWDGFFAVFADDVAMNLQGSERRARGVRAHVRCLG